MKPWSVVEIATVFALGISAFAHADETPSVPATIRLVLLGFVCAQAAGAEGTLPGPGTVEPGSRRVLPS